MGLPSDCRSWLLSLILTTSQRQVCAVPGNCFYLAFTNVGFERALCLGTAPKKKPGCGEAIALSIRLDERIGPNGVQTFDRSHVDKFVQVAVPGATVLSKNSSRRPPSINTQRADRMVGMPPSSPRLNQKRDNRLITKSVARNSQIRNRPGLTRGGLPGDFWRCVVRPASSR